MNSALDSSKLMSTHIKSRSVICIHRGQCGRLTACNCSRITSLTHERNWEPDHNLLRIGVSGREGVESL